MPTLTIFNNTSTAPGYKQPDHFDSYLALHPRQAFKIIKEPSIEFIAVLAHEVRNPLTNISLSLEMLASVLKDSNQKVYLDIIKRSSVRINDLVNELLKYQQAELVQTEKHSIHLLLEEVLRMAADRVLLKNIEVRRFYSAQDCAVELNRPKMKIALTNIIINAIDAMADMKGHLTIITKSKESKFLIEIEDNGCGISKENLKNIFKPYFTNKPGGLGLGLTATCDILRSNHVRVNVESEEGRGTRFILMFNRHQSNTSLIN
jgi:signal transduction histidine kinase